MKCYVGANEEDKGHKRSTVQLAIKKLQYAPPVKGITRLPSSLVSKGFTFSSGKINLEVTLDKDTYYHGEKIGANIMISNNSRKQVRNIKVYVVQHCEVSLLTHVVKIYVILFLVSGSSHLISFVGDHGERPIFQIRG